MKKAQAAEESKSAAGSGDVFEGFLDPKTNKFSYDDLKAGVPKGVKGTHKPHYLSDAEFEKVMGMKHDAYDLLKEWKKTDIKKKVGLF